MSSREEPECGKERGPVGGTLIGVHVDMAGARDPYDALGGGQARPSARDERGVRAPGGVSLSLCMWVNYVVHH
jgi:hypothetical protein